MQRTKLIDRLLPDYTRGEEIFNMVSHIVGGGLGVVVCALCVIKAFLDSDAYGIVGAFRRIICFHKESLFISIFSHMSLYQVLFKKSTA